MSHYKQIEYWLDDRTVLVGEVALGERNSLDYKSFNVIVYIQGIDRDVTSSFSERTLESFKKSFEWHVMNKYLEVLKFNLEDEVG